MNIEPATRKLSVPEAPLTKLKLLWRDELAEADRDYWREQFASARTQADLRRELNERHHIELNQDIQLTRFRSWITQQDIRDQAAADLEELQRQGLTGALLRDKLIERMKARAWNNDDFNLALKAIAADIKNETLQLGHKKFEHASRTKIEAGLCCLSQEIRGNPAAKAAFDAFCAIVEPDKAANPKTVQSPEPNRPAAPKPGEGGNAGHRPGSLDTASTIPSAPPAAPTCHVEVGRRREPGVGGLVASERSEDGTQSDPIQPTPEPAMPEPAMPEPSRNIPSNNPLIHQSNHPAASRPTCSATSIGPISPMRPIAQNPTQSDLIKPTAESVGRMPSRGNPPANPSIQPSINPSAPAPNPQKAYEECEWRMRINLEPYDQEKLLRLHAAIPRKQRRTLSP